MTDKPKRAKSASTAKGREVTGKDREKTAALFAFIQERLQAIGMSSNAASMKAGLKRDAIRDIGRGSPPGPMKLTSLAAVLGVAPEQLLRLIPSGIAAEPEKRQVSSGSSIDQRERVRFDAGPHDLMLVRQEDRGVDSGFADVPVTFIARPESLTGRSSGYAVYINDDLNAPWVRAGHIAYVDPSRPAQTGSQVRVFPRKGAPFVAILQESTSARVVVTVLTEPAPRIFAASDIERLERVVAISVIDA